jgi:hypothetical protein
MVTDGDFQRAIGGGAKSGAHAAQNQAQPMSAEICQVSQETQKTPENQGFCVVLANHGQSRRNLKMVRTEPSSNISCPVRRDTAGLRAIQRAEMSWFGPVSEPNSRL